MKAPRQYLDAQSLTTGDEIALPKDASKYLVRVLRKNTGDVVTLFNGDGHDYSAVILHCSSPVVVKITEKTVNGAESPLSITLVQSLAKGSKLDLVIQKATELGVQRIVPVIADRSVVQIDDDRQKKKMDHWRGVAISACAQCGRSALPDIEPPSALNDWINRSSVNGLLLHPRGDRSITTVPVNNQSCSIFIGPEGGFSESELAMAKGAGLQIVTCGPRVLRTETAGFSAVAVLQARFGDL